MERRPGLAEQGTTVSRASPVRNQRQHYRHSVSSLAYVRLDHANGGIIRNLSESGIAIQAVGRLHPGQLVHLRFELMKPKVRIDATGQVAWSDPSGQAGLHFVDLPGRTRQLVKDWVFTDLLAAATELAPSRSPIFGTREDEMDGLIVSAPRVPPIRIAKPDIQKEADESKKRDQSAEMPLRLSWWPADISQRAFARFVDSLVVTSAVLLFSVIAVQITGIFPSWMLAFALLALVAALFGFVYRYLFTTLMGMTLGRKLARLAAEDMYWIRETRDDEARFR